MNYIFSPATPEQVHQRQIDLICKCSPFLTVVRIATAFGTLLIEAPMVLIPFAGYYRGNFWLIVCAFGALGIIIYPLLYHHFKNILAREEHVVAFLEEYRTADLNHFKFSMVRPITFIILAFMLLYWMVLSVMRRGSL